MSGMAYKHLNKPSRQINVNARYIGLACLALLASGASFLALTGWNVY